MTGTDSPSDLLDILRACTKVGIPIFFQSRSRPVFGKAASGDLAELQRIIDEDCRKIDYAEWGLPDPNAPS